MFHTKYLDYTGHLCHSTNTMMMKKTLFTMSKKPYYRDTWINISKMLNVSIKQAKGMMHEKACSEALIENNLTM